ncbi:response regulator receiver and ANTAR domain protein [Clostridium sp. CAG:413]|nr:response regulator receiver and ANTAR domain protein [Clostridium sp. CAG:413]
MTSGRTQYRVLIVSAVEKIYEYITEILPPGEFSPILRAASAGEAKRMLVSDEADIVIINTPLPDEFGTELALDLSGGTAGVLLLVKNDYFDQVCYKVEREGVLTVGKPSSKQTLYGAVKLAAAMSARLAKMERKNKTLQEKMADIRTVNRAKWLLIENLNMTERDAHYYIEKQAMNMRLSRHEVAENIIRTYDK